MTVIVAARTITWKISERGQNLVYSEITKALVLASVICKKKKKKILCCKGQQSGTENKIGQQLKLSFLVSSGTCSVFPRSRKKKLLTVYF